MGAAAMVLLPDEPSEDTASDPSANVEQVAEATATSDEGRRTAPASRPDIPENWILATVEDPDGHSNVRRRPTTASDIVGRVQVGETFRARRESGNWWPVELSDGSKGFIAKRLIRVLPAGGARPVSLPGTIILERSSDRALIARDLEELTNAELRIARNEIFARKGYIFPHQDLNRHFEQFDWYEAANSNVELSDVERANVALIRSVERTNGN